MFAGDPPTCRICFGPAQPQQRGGRLVQPCCCRGTIGHAHEGCLAEQLRHSRSHDPRTCGVCYAPLQLPAGALFWRNAKIAAATLAVAAAFGLFVVIGVRQERAEQRAREAQAASRQLKQEQYDCEFQQHIRQYQEQGQQRWMRRMQQQQADRERREWIWRQQMRLDQPPLLQRLRQEWGDELWGSASC